MNIRKDLNLEWIPVYHEMSLEFLKYKSDRGFLVEMLKKGFKNTSWKVNRIKDENPEGNKIDLKDICPFTLFRFLNYDVSLVNRNNLLETYINELDLKKKLGPKARNFKFTGEEALPLARPRERIWFFPYEYDRNPDDIDKLWDMFESAIKYADNNDTNPEHFVKAYDASIDVTYNSHNKLSQTLYALRPTHYPTLDTYTAGYLQKHHKDIKNKPLRNIISNDLIKRKYNGAGYIKIADGLQKEFESKYGKDDVFIGLSHDAYTDPGDTVDNGTNNGENNKGIIHPLNKILYGPPGTGKTYQTAQLAVEIITGERQKVTTSEERDALMEKYHKFKKQMRIRFITFHQSYGYEEFVEGIKPKITSDDSNAQEKSNSDIEYQIKPGIFRQICEDAEEVEPPKNVWAVRLWFGPKKKEEKEFKQKCFDSDSIAVKEKARGLKEFNENCKVGDLIIVPAYSSGKDWNVLAIGRLKSDTENPNTDKGVLRWGVKWIWHELDQPKRLAKYWTPDRKKTSLASGTIMQQIEGIDSKKLLKDLPKVHFDEEAKRKPYVLIIDEINRGNISKILGELITLLEEDKRSGGGNKEALEVTLPYSNDPFSVPNNLYIIGTMNTADRSIAFLDTALRRRFKFEAVMPNPDLLEQEIKGIELKELLKAMNKKIKEHLGRDHQIGHSYFLKVKDLEDLIEVFRNDICPLLDEYFYDRRELIADVLNKSALIYKDGDKDTTWEWAKDKDFKELRNYTKIYGK